MIMSHFILVRMRNFSEKKAVEKIKTHILCSVTFFPENLAVCEIMWKNIIEPGIPQMVIPHICCACWISAATDTHLEYVILIAFYSDDGYVNAPECFMYIYVASLINVVMRFTA